jgi:hypothetical protein
MIVHPLHVGVQCFEQPLKRVLKIVVLAQEDVLVGGQVGGYFLIGDVAVLEGHHALVVVGGVIELILAGL